jgi:hypothetical protein
MINISGGIVDFFIIITVIYGALISHHVMTTVSLSNSGTFKGTVTHKNYAMIGIKRKYCFILWIYWVSKHENSHVDLKDKISPTV